MNSNCSLPFSSWDSKFFASPSPSRGSEIFPVVYQDPYRIFASTVSLLQEFPELASHVRRLWFSGIYQFHHVSKIFDLTRSCNNLVSISLPWSSLRYGTVEDWIHVTNNLRITSLEFLGEDLKQSHICADVNTAVNHKALGDIRVNFSKLRRLKIHGSSNVQGIVDTYLWEIARTAVNLEEVHITGNSSVTIEGMCTLSQNLNSELTRAVGVTALLSSSRTTLKVINYAPTTPTVSGMPKIHVCDIVTSCPNLIDVNITVPQLCEHLLCPLPQYTKNMIQFDELLSKWNGVAIIRLLRGGRTCLHPNLPLEHPENCAEVQRILDTARKLQQITSGVAVELTIGKFTFSPANFSVAGDFRGAKKLAEGMWQPERERESRRGPWGSSGLCEDIGGRTWTEIGEVDFFYGVNCGLIRYES